MSRAGLRLCFAAAAVSATTAGIAAAGDSLVVLQDLQPPYTKGSYLAYASPWSTFTVKQLVHGKDYLDTIEIHPSRFPDNTVIDFRWPTWPSPTGVWGYHAVSFGNYDGGAVQKPVRPLQVKDIHQLSEEFRFSSEGSGNFNLLNEFYLTSEPGNPSKKIIEIGFFLHTPPPTRNFFDHATPVATYTDSEGRRWKIAGGKFIMIMPENYAELPQGTIDIKPFLDLLIAKGVIHGTEWFNGIAFGAEPTAGGGQTRLTVDHWSVTYR